MLFFHTFGSRKNTNNLYKLFRREEKDRTSKHNRQIASLLSFIAGVVNVIGIISIGKLTTNVTGHFGFFTDEIFQFNFSESIIYFLYVLFFFLGSFVSNVFVEIVAKINNKYIYVIPALIEALILLVLAIFGEYFLNNSPNVIAFTLLFAMGLQNALVTIISNAIVRTTHLTGLFTDLGIEISQLLFYNTPSKKKKLLSTIRLRFRIIFSFFLGGILGGILYSHLRFGTLFIPVGLLLFGIRYDNIKYEMLKFGKRINPF